MTKSMKLVKKFSIVNRDLFWLLAILKKGKRREKKEKKKKKERRDRQDENVRHSFHIPCYFQYTYLRERMTCTIYRNVPDVTDRIHSIL